MLALTIRKGDRESICLTLGLTLGILLTLTRTPIFATVGLIIHMLTSLLISIFNLRHKEFSTFYQLTIILSGIWAFVSNLFSIMEWPFAEEIRLTIIIPILFYMINLFYGMLKRKEFGYLTIINMEFILRIIR
jgi:hypothetical protein